MIMTVAKLRQIVTTDKTDQEIEARLQALESLIRAYTNNNFQKRAFRTVAVAVAAGNQLMVPAAIPFKAGDTLEITESEYNTGLVTIGSIEGQTMTVNEPLCDESGVVITKVVYPADVKLGAARMLQWQLENGDKVGVQSETISRHSVTYFNMDGDNFSPSPCWASCGPTERPDSGRGYGYDRRKCVCGYSVQDHGDRRNRCPGGDLGGRAKNLGLAGFVRNE